MIKRLTGLVPLRRPAGLILLLCLLAAPAGAQPDAGWQAWLYEAASGRLLQIDAAGTPLQVVPLPAAPGETYAPAVAFSASGDRVAYVRRAPSAGQHTLVVYDLAQGAEAAAFSLPAAPAERVHTMLDIRGERTIFTQDGGELAFGYQMGDEWSVVVMDTGSGAVTATLTNDHPQLTDTAGRLPVVRFYNGLDVYFTLVDVEAPDAPGQGYGWNVASDSVTRSELFRTLHSDIFPRTSEIILTDPEASQRLQAGQAGLPGAVTVYEDSEARLAQPRFIQNGERVVALAQGGTAGRTWRVIDRGGRVTGTLAIGDYVPDRLHSTADGLLYSGGTNQIVAHQNELLDHLDTTAVLAIRTRGGFEGEPGEVIWTGERGESYQLAHVVDPAADTLPLPAAWEASPPPPQFDLGDTAQIGAAGAELRSGPGIDFGVVAALAGGEVVTLLEGPREQAGLIWWRVRTGSGAEGWVLQETAEAQVVLQPYTEPTATPTTPPPTLTPTPPPTPHAHPGSIAAAAHRCPGPRDPRR